MIGSNTFINFPKFGIKKVPAKVDTGADSSSVWASNIAEKNGKLSFSLFAPNSPFYTGEVINTRDFEISSIKNSFGHTEFRYKVKLSVEIEGRTIKARFTLSNRSENNFPILIGRRTLHGRFLVDVSIVPAKSRYDILVLKPKLPKEGGKIASFFKDIEQEKKVRFTFATYKDLEFNINNRKMSIRIGQAGREVSSFDMVYFFIVSAEKDIASAVAQYLKSCSVPFADKAVAGYYQSLNKLHQYILLNLSGVRVPGAIYIDNSQLVSRYDDLVASLGSPFILKDIHGRKGRGNYLVNSEIELANILKKSTDLKMIAQKFVPNDGDYRLLIFGKKVKLAISRTAGVGSHLNNVSQGGQAELADPKYLPASAKRMAIKAAEATSVDIAGVDIVKDKGKKLWYCLEVNESPQLASGSFVDEKREALTEYIYRRLQKIL
jgi:glutathione synthase/RimK-type ligase-like ATP-grasp enzyme